MILVIVTIAILLFFLFFLLSLLYHPRQPLPAPAIQRTLGACSCNMAENGAGKTKAMENHHVFWVYQL